MGTEKFAVVDLFSGVGGMSFGFHKHPLFSLAAAADAELGKPSSGAGALQCNSAYRLNTGVCPTKLDLSDTPPETLRAALGLPETMCVSVLSACPPCTGFSRANPENHLRDDFRNSLVRKSAEFALALDAEIVVMENARELIRGNFDHHYQCFRSVLEENGYDVFGSVYLLSRFGLPQLRERAIVLAVKRKYELRTLDRLWEGWNVDERALTVRRAFDSIDPNASATELFPDFSSESVRRRIEAIPSDGGSWMDLLKRKDAERLLTDSMKRIVERNRFGSYPDVYGRMAWDKPAPTIKRECAHVGNGRYAHPERHRLCSVREMAILQGFPNDFEFNGSSLANTYRHIGDAVPPLISYQLACLCAWMLTGERPEMEEILLPGTSIQPTDLLCSRQMELLYA